jgi:hypothetical protein
MKIGSFWVDFGLAAGQKNPNGVNSGVMGNDAQSFLVGFGIMGEDQKSFGVYSGFESED